MGLKLNVRETRSLFVLETIGKKIFTIAYFPKHLAGGSRDRAKKFARLTKILFANSGLKTIFGLILCLGLYSCQPAFAHPVNMKILAEIESSNNPKAHNKKSGARGLYQITPLVLKQYNESNPMHDYHLDIKNPIVFMDHQLKPDELFDESINYFVAYFYLDWLSQRCDTVDEILIAWNWGIAHLRNWKHNPFNGVSGPSLEELPRETQDFLRKYHEKELALENNKI